MTMEKKLEKYEAYVNEVLRTDLSKICEELNLANSDLAEYDQLEKTIEMMNEYKKQNEVFKTLTDIGCNFFMQNNIDDFSSILLNIGYGYHLEFTLDEALIFIRTKQTFLNTRIESLREKSAKVKAHIKLMLMLMDKLQVPNCT